MVYPFNPYTTWQIKNGHCRGHTAVRVCSPPRPETGPCPVPSPWWRGDVVGEVVVLSPIALPSIGISVLVLLGGA